jgi:hypothetical protein
VRPYLRNSGDLEDTIRQLTLARLGEDYVLMREADWDMINRLYLFVPHPYNLLPAKPNYIADY